MQGVCTGKYTKTAFPSSNNRVASILDLILVNDKVLHNCMLDSGESSNVMTKKVMEQLNLRISQPYHNICALNSQTIEVYGLIKGLQVHLTIFSDIMIEMDIVLIDVPDVWGMLLNRKAAADLGGSLQMDLLCHPPYSRRKHFQVD